MDTHYGERLDDAFYLYLFPVIGQLTHSDGSNIERDSNKDKAVVFIFIIATSGLLLWAAVRPWAEKWIAVR